MILNLFSWNLNTYKTHRTNLFSFYLFSFYSLFTNCSKKPTIWTSVAKTLQIAKFQYCKLVEDSSWFIIHWTVSTVLENWMTSLGKQGFIYTYFFLAKIVTAQTWPSRVSRLLNKNNQWTIIFLSNILLYATVLVFLHMYQLQWKKISYSN